MQFTAVLSDHVDPSFLLSSPLSGSTYIAVVCYFGVSFVLHPIQMSKVWLPRVPYSVYYSNSDILTVEYFFVFYPVSILMFLIVAKTTKHVVVITMQYNCHVVHVLH